MKLPGTDTLRVDAPFALIAIAATLGAAALAAAPYLLDHGPTPAQQKELLSERRSLATEGEKDIATVTTALATLEARNKEAVHLLHASAVIPRVVLITALATECSTSITQIAPQPALPAAPVVPSGRDKVAIVPIKISGTATYENATRFLSLLRTRFRDTAVTGIHIAAAPSDSSPNAACTFDLAWYTDPASSAASADPAAKAP